MIFKRNSTNMFEWLQKKDTTVVEKSNEQKTEFDDAIARDILHDIKEEFGLDYSRQEEITLRKIERFSLKNNIYNFSDLKTEIKTSSELKEQLINMLTIGETYFYREAGHFKILTQLMEKRPIQSILCAPSSSGEEVYSILLYIQEHFSKIPDITITGIDINSDFIQAAKDASYSTRSISLLPKGILQNNFTLNNSKYSLSPTLKKYAHFQKQNIFDQRSLSRLGMFDIIFCRNMLIYFDEKQKKEALENLHKILLKDGLLFIGHADISFDPKGFQKIHSENGTYLQKLF